MYPVQAYKVPRKPIDYASLNSTYKSKDTFKIPLYQNKVSRLPDAPGLAINTDFRPETSRVLPLVPASFNYNYGFPAAKPNVSSLFGSVPQYGTPLTKIGKGDYPILEPVNLYKSLPMKC